MQPSRRLKNLHNTRMQLHDLKTETTSPRSHRVGRGGKRGKTSGRGHKGQKSRAGNKPRPQWRDTIKKIPKRRGYGKNRGKTVVPKSAFAVVAVSVLSSRFSDGDTVTPQALVKSGVIRRRGGKVRPIKILAGGKIDKKLILQGISVSESAKEAILKAGGSVNA